MNKQENLLLSKFGNDPKELAEALREFSKSAERLSSDLPRLIDKHRKQWIGVFRGEVTAAASSLDRLLAKLEKKGIPPGETVVRFIEENQRTLILIKKVATRPVSRAKAIRIAHGILKRAERERLTLAVNEAGQGIQWDDE